MGTEETNRIKNFFSKGEYKVEYLEHEPVITSEQASKQRGFELKQGVKAILFTDGKGNWVVVDVPADRKVDAKKVAAFLGWSKSRIRIATEPEVMDKTGCQIGAVPPFGHKEQIKILVDKGVFNNKANAFNIGLRTHSVKIPTEELKRLIEELGAVEGEFTAQ